YYEIDGAAYEGYVARPEVDSAPVVLVVHAWCGQSSFEREKAVALAELGYVGFAIDLFGKGRRGATVEENQALIKPFTDDRSLLQARMTASLDIGRSLSGVKKDKSAAIGFCFGGLSVLDLARSGSNVSGVVSFHGLLSAADNLPDPKISSKVLVLHGWDDPMAPPSDVLALSQELTGSGADWQLHAYGGTLHAFTNPDANDVDFGVKFDAGANQRAFTAMRNFLEEVLD
ncbi:MAG: dienelactone hydrolase family protein, partial [Pseudomonadota bacterium]